MKKIAFILLIAFTGKLFAQNVLPDVSGIKVTHSILCTPVKDQYLSATCWSFAGNSFIESEILKNKGIKIDLSEMFIARYSYINKVYQYLSQNGKIFFTPGGQFHDEIKVIEQYGMLPEAVYSGKVNGELNHNHTRLDTIMKYYVADLLAKHATTLSPSDLKYINTILDTYLGKVPSTFMYNGKMYTPKTFAIAIGFVPDDYVEITSYTHHPFYQKFILEDKYNWTKDGYYNVPLDDFMEITNTAISNNYSVCWDGDATDDGFRFDKGVAWLTYPVTNFQMERQRTYEDKSSELDHMMHVTGIAKDKNNVTWCQVKNSWGITNNLGGYLFMREDYFKIKTIAIIVNKNAVPAAIRKKMNI
ncbi:MAG TPA: C1 family peptidase [Chitinophagaceae bacterium]